MRTSQSWLSVVIKRLTAPNERYLQGSDLEGTSITFLFTHALLADYLRTLLIEQRNVYDYPHVLRCLCWLCVPTDVAIGFLSG